jgi:hypothetical protein
VGSIHKITIVTEYADNDAVDGAVEIWQKGLLPWTKKTAGPPVANKLVSIEPKWYGTARKGVYFQELHWISVTNVSGMKLTHLVVEAHVSNEWNDKAANYYYISALDAGSTCHLKLHPRWINRRMFSRDMTLKYTVWAAEHSNVGHTVTINNLQPPPDADNYRREVLEWDNGELGKMGSRLARSIQQLQ